MWGNSMATPHVTGTAALCIARGLCTGTPASMIRKLVQDAAAQGSPYGFGGDPWRPVFGRYYGYLVRPAAY
jgi:subtilisin family serine protease